MRSTKLSLLDTGGVRKMIPGDGEFLATGAGGLEKERSMTAGKVHFLFSGSGVTGAFVFLCGGALIGLEERSMIVRTFFNFFVGVMGHGRGFIHSEKVMTGSLLMA